jgi:hypothetical protein
VLGVVLDDVAELVFDGVCVCVWFCATATLTTAATTTTNATAPMICFIWLLPLARSSELRAE